MKNYILTLDQGTTSSRAIIYNKNAEICAVAQKEFNQIFPKKGWVEHSPKEIWKSQITVVTEAIADLGIHDDEIATIGITNQRETTIIWDKKTGNPIYNAIVWQDRRTANYCNELIKAGYTEKIKQKTGLEIDSYFSATKIKWILDNVKDARTKAENGELAFGTVDSWLIWNLTGKKQHLTDITNASRTMLFNIKTHEWDKELLKIFQIPEQILPKVKLNADNYGVTSLPLFGTEIPINGVAGDQQSAMFGQMCINKGMVKNTYGTGCFLMLNTGENAVFSENRLLTTIAWKINNKITYALEGSVFIGGAVVQWLRDGLEILKTSNSVEELAKKVEDNGGVYFVPAFTGLGAPYWDSNATGIISGITRDTKKAHIARAALESIAFQTNDVLRAMEKDANFKIKRLRVDGGAAVNNLLMQFQSDITNIEIDRPQILESTSLGVAYFAGLQIGFWKDINEISKKWKIEKEFSPKMKLDQRNNLLNNWKNIIRKSTT